MVRVVVRLLVEYPTEGHARVRDVPVIIMFIYLLMIIIYSPLMVHQHHWGPRGPCHVVSQLISPLQLDDRVSRRSCASFACCQVLVYTCV
jgi:hypothetical protein